jgi:hypothetical protein
MEEKCCCHCTESATLKLQQSTDAAAQVIKRSAEVWKSMVGDSVCVIEHESAIKILESPEQHTFNYHQPCYQKFTNSRRLQQALNRQAKNVQCASKTKTTPEPSTKTLRSQSTSTRYVIFTMLVK